MANQRKVGLKIEIDGEAEYKKAIQNINKDNQLLNAELKTLAEQYKNNSDSMDYLVQKGEKLESRLIEQEAKVTLLRDALRKATEEFGTADERTTEWAIKLANAETELAKTKNAIDENNAAMDKNTTALEKNEKAVGGLGDQLDQLGGMLGIRIPDMAREALNGIEGFSSGTVASMGLAAAGIAAAIKVTKELYALTKQAAAEADALLTRSAQTGLSTDLLQQLDYAQNFLDFDGLDRSLQNLTRSMGNATTESSKQAQAFKELGVEIYDENGKLRDNYAVFLDVIDALGDMDNKTRADIIANQLFGKSYADLKPLIEAGSGALKQYTDRAQEMGYVIDKEVIERLGRFDDALQENKTAVSTAKTELAGYFAPLFQGIVEGGTGAINVMRSLFGSDIMQIIAESSNPLLNVVGRARDLAEAFYDAKDAKDAFDESAQDTPDLSGAITPMQEAVQALAEKYQEAQEKYQSMLEGRFGLFTDVSEYLSGTVDDTAQKLEEFWNSAYESAEKSISGQFGLFKEASTEVEHTADDIIKALESQITYWTQYEENLDAVMNSGVEGIREFAQEFTDGSAKSVEMIAILAAATDEQKEQILASYQALQDKQSEVAAGYADMATAGAESSGELAESTESFMQRSNAALDSQLQYWQEYREDFDALKNRNIEGINELAAKFMDGSAESKAALAELRGASDEDIAAIIQKMREVAAERGDLGNTFAAMEVDLAGQLAKIKADWVAAVQEISGTAGAVDFTPFKTAVTLSFGYLTETAKTGNASMVTAFKDGNTGSQEELEKLKTGSAEKIEAIIETLGTTEQAKEEFTQRFDDMTEHTVTDLDQISEITVAFVEEFNGTIAMIDFSPFTDSVDSAFSFLEDRAWSSIDNVRVWLAELSAEIDAIEARAANVNVGHNAGGTDNWRGGLTYLAENGPELVDLPQGSRVHTAQETRQILGGGTDMRETEAKLTQAVSLLGQISAELSGLRMRGRMV